MIYQADLERWRKAGWCHEEEFEQILDEVEQLAAQLGGVKAALASATDEIEQLAAELPECVRAWREATKFHGLDADYHQLKRHRIQLDCGECICEDGGRNKDSPAGAAIRCLDWLGTASPAVIVAANESDVVVLRKRQAVSGLLTYVDAEALQRATVIPSSELDAIRARLAEAKAERDRLLNNPAGREIRRLRAQLDRLREAAQALVKAYRVRPLYDNSAVYTESSTAACPSKQWRALLDALDSL